MSFDKKLAALLAERGMEVAELARSVGISPQAVSQWKVGKTMPVGARLARVASALGVSVPELMAECSASVQPSSEVVEDRDELRWLNLWRKMLPETREAVLLTLDAVIAKREDAA